MTKKADTMTKKQKFPIDRKFTDAELQKKGARLAQLIDEKSNLEDKLKEETSRIKTDIKAKDTEINIVRKHITTGTENVLVDGEVIYDGKENTKSFWYKGVCYDTKPLDSEDMQAELDLAEEKE